MPASLPAALLDELRTAGRPIDMHVPLKAHDAMPVLSREEAEHLLRESSEAALTALLQAYAAAYILAGGDPEDDAVDSLDLAVNELLTVPTA